MNSDLTVQVTRCIYYLREDHSNQRGRSGSQEGQLQLIVPPHATALTGIGGTRASAHTCNQFEYDVRGRGYLYRKLRSKIIIMTVFVDQWQKLCPGLAEARLNARHANDFTDRQQPNSTAGTSNISCSTRPRMALKRLQARQASESLCEIGHCTEMTINGDVSILIDSTSCL